MSEYLISANSSSPELSIICCFFFSSDMTTVGDSSELKNFSAGNFTVAKNKEQLNQSQELNHNMNYLK